MAKLALKYKSLSKDELYLISRAEFEKPIGFFKFLELEEYLEMLLGLKVDLVTKKALKPAIGSYILDELITV